MILKYFGKKFLELLPKYSYSDLLKLYEATGDPNVFPDSVDSNIKWEWDSKDLDLFKETVYYYTIPQTDFQCEVLELFDMLPEYRKLILSHDCVFFPDQNYRESLSSIKVDIDKKYCDEDIQILFNVFNEYCKIFYKFHINPTVQDFSVREFLYVTVGLFRYLDNDDRKSILSFMSESIPWILPHTISDRNILSYILNCYNISNILESIDTNASLAFSHIETQDTGVTAEYSSYKTSILEDRYDSIYFNWLNRLESDAWCFIALIISAIINPEIRTKYITDWLIEEVKK